MNDSRIICLSPPCTGQALVCLQAGFDFSLLLENPVQLLAQQFVVAVDGQHRLHSPVERLKALLQCLPPVAFLLGFRSLMRSLQDLLSQMRNHEQHLAEIPKDGMLDGLGTNPRTDFV